MQDTAFGVTADLSVLRTWLTSLSATEASILAIAFSFALFSIQQAAAYRSFRAVQVILGDRVIAGSFIVLGFLSLFDGIAALLPLSPMLAGFCVGLALAGLGATFAIIWMSFANVARLLDPATVVAFWHGQGLRSLEAFGGLASPAFAREVITLLVRDTADLELLVRRARGSTRQAINSAFSLRVALDELLFVADQARTIPQSTRVRDALSAMRDLVTQTYGRLQLGLELHLRTVHEQHSTLDPFLSDYVEMIRRLRIRAIKDGQVEAAQAAVHALADLSIAIYGHAT